VNINPKRLGGIKKVSSWEDEALSNPSLRQSAEPVAPRSSRQGG